MPGSVADPAGTPIAAADRHWMQRALRQASRCLGTTWPNPGVGCVLVRAGQVLGEGRTAPRGADHIPQEHAEAAAVRQAHAAGHDLRGATAFVTLAPCTKRSHPGCTACSTVLRQVGIARVVIALTDPQQPASVVELEAAGVVVDTGIEADLARQIHGGFLTRAVAKRPRFTGKWAMTLDGCLAAHTGASGWISSPEALALARRRRRAFDAILIGHGTARADDPQLLAVNARQRAGTATPLRIVLAADGQLAAESHLLSTLDQAPLLVVHGAAADASEVRAWGAEAQGLADPHDVRQLALLLGGWGLHDVLVEGGATIHGEFLRAGLYDRLELYQGATTLGGGLPIARGEGAPAIPDGQTWVPETAPRLLGTTILSRWQRA